MLDQTTRTNQSECQDLAYKICEHLSTLAVSLQPDSLANASRSAMETYDDVDLCEFQVHIEDLYRYMVV